MPRSVALLVALVLVAGPSSGQAARHEVVVGVRPIVAVAWRPAAGPDAAGVHAGALALTSNTDDLRLDLMLEGLSAEACTVVVDIPDWDVRIELSADSPRAERVRVPTSRLASVVPVGVSLTGAVPSGIAELTLVANARGDAGRAGSVSRWRLGPMPGS